MADQDIFGRLLQPVLAQLEERDGVTQLRLIERFLKSCFVDSPACIAEPLALDAHRDPALTQLLTKHGAITFGKLPPGRVHDVRCRAVPLKLHRDGRFARLGRTEQPPADDAARRHAAVQLAVYRLAWAGLSGLPPARVRAAFHYVRSGRTVTPESLPGPQELAALLRPERCA